MDYAESTLQSSEPFRVTIVRHGKARYKQDRVRIEEANDLLGEGVQAVSASAELLVPVLRTETQVSIWSSPFGRTLHTAKTMRQVLLRSGISTHVETRESLCELRNFSWPFLIALVEGGFVDILGESLLVNHSATNTRGLNRYEYLRLNAIREIPQNVVQSWPERIQDLVRNLESFKSATGRMMQVLKDISQFRLARHTILVTHEALTSFIMMTITNNRVLGLDPGSYIILEQQGDDFIPVYIQGIEVFDRTPVIRAFEQAYPT